MKRKALGEKINQLETRLKQLKWHALHEAFVDTVSNITGQLNSTAIFLQKIFEYMKKLNGVEYVKDKKLEFFFSDGCRLVLRHEDVIFTAFPEMDTIDALEKHLMEGIKCLYLPRVVACAVDGFLLDFIHELHENSDYTYITDDNIDEICEWMNGYRMSGAE